MASLIASATAQKITFDKNYMWVTLNDGRVLGVPLAYFPRLAQATAKQKKNYSFSGNGKGAHWEDIDEDILIPALFTDKLCSKILYQGLI